MNTVINKSSKTLEDVVLNLKTSLECASEEAVKNRGVFTIGLSGGSLVSLFAKALKNINADLKKWVLFFCDERVVPFDSEDSTFGLYKKALDGLLDESQFVAINPLLSASEAAVDYTTKIKVHFPNVEWPSFDVLLLGIGPDGHTCSLFPNHPLLKEEKLWVAPITDSPKPPPSRITLTFPVLNRARNVIISLAGDGKAEIIKKILIDKEDLPITRVKPINGKLLYILDSGAAKFLD